MIRTTITPTETNVILPVPENYIGKKIEVLMFDVEEVATEKTASKIKPSQLRGFLSVETAEALLQNIQQSRQEWDT
jgi:hypothetical protein